MSEKLAQTTPKNPEPQPMQKDAVVMQLCPAECRDLVRRFSVIQSKDISQDAKCLVILDVRTSQEYNAGHLNGSINLDLKSASFSDQIRKLNRNNAYLLYCRTGIRSARAVMLMISLGFMELYNLTKGIEQWQRDGFEVVLDS
jgi:rhodanese-related sulfurtransferase